MIISTDQASYMKTKSSILKKKERKKKAITITTLRKKNQNPELLNVQFSTSNQETCKEIGKCHSYLQVCSEVGVSKDFKAIYYKCVQRLMKGNHV